MISKPLLKCFGAFLVLAVSQAGGNDDAKEALPLKNLNDLTKESLPGVSHIEIKGTDPRILYIPIIHDNPEHETAAAETVATIQEYLENCRKISERLYRDYGVQNILLEGIGEELAGKYNSPEYKGRKLSVGKSKSVTFKVWFDLLNNNPWHLVPAYEKKQYGPLTLLGSEYTRRIQKALAEAKENGWFKSRDGFVANQKEFTKLINQACEGYNDRLEKILEEDPRLQNEYDITVGQRNKVFIENTLAADGVGIILCGGGHVQDLIAQFNEQELSYAVIVPEGSEWPPAVKDDEKIFNDMRKLGCQLKKCTLKFGDGTAATIQMPIK